MRRQNHGLTRMDEFQRSCMSKGPSVPDQTFGCLFPRNPLIFPKSDSATVTAKRRELTETFEALLNSEGVRAPDDQGQDIIDGFETDAGQTFFGQFIDHDITLDATSAIGTKISPRSVRNVRTPSLDLDCIYGDGPEASPHLYAGEHLVIGHRVVTVTNGAPQEDNRPHDLARHHFGKALIGDFRNDENAVVSAIQALFIRAHNALIDQMSDPETGAARIGALASQMMDFMDRETVKEACDMAMNDGRCFELARMVLRAHYQYLVFNEFLEGFIAPEVYATVQQNFRNRSLPAQWDGIAMPIEFAVAGFRFGHATVRNTYKIRDHNFIPLFERDPALGFGQPFSSRPHHVDLKLFFGPGSQKARPVAFKFADSLFNLPMFAESPIEIDGEVVASSEQARILPLRNILRDRFAFELEEFDEAAKILGFENHRVEMPQVLDDANHDKIPLWVGILLEAERFGGKLGRVGGSIVGNTFVKLLLDDHESIDPFRFRPFALGADEDAFTMRHLVNFVEGYVAALEDPMAYASEKVVFMP